MDRDFTLATELTEVDVGSDMRVAHRVAGSNGATGAGSGLNLQAATNGGLGLLIACLALWALYLVFPGNQRAAGPDTTHVNRPAVEPAAPSAQQQARPRPDAVKVEMGSNGVVIKRRHAAASAPASGAAQATRKPAQPATQPATQADHDGADRPASAADTTQ